MALIRTIRGLQEESELSRFVTFNDRPKEFTIEVEWYASDGVLVRRDAHVVLKEATVVADGIAAAIG